MNESKANIAKRIDERLSRLGVSVESAARLSRKAQEAKNVLGIHGVSVTAGEPPGRASSADRSAVELVFAVHDTPTRGDSLHRTVELPSQLQLRRPTVSISCSDDRSDTMTVSDPPAILHEGVNDPSPITRVISLDWRDGPIDGVLQLGDAGPAFKFHLIDQQRQTDDTDIRVYGLYPLPADSVPKLVEALTPHSSPRWPIWSPIWQFPTDEVRRDVEARTNDVLGRAGPLTWVIVGELADGPIRALPVVAALAS